MFTEETKGSRIKLWGAAEFRGERQEPTKEVRGEPTKEIMKASKTEQMRVESEKPMEDST